MQLKQPILANVNVKMARGLSADARMAAVDSFGRSKLVLSVVEALAEAQYVNLKPGEETKILVELPRDQLPANVDVKSVSATLHVPKPGPTGLKGREQSVVGVKDLGPSTSPDPDAPERSFALRMDASGGPRNVELRLDTGPAFWTHAGTLEEGSYTLPDFSEQLNQVLDKVQPEGRSIPLRFLLKSDTPGKVRIQIGRIEYSVLHTQSWTNPLDDTLRVDRNLQLDFGSRERIPLEPPKDLPQGGFSLANLTMDIGGELGPERLLGDVSDHGGREFAMINSQFSLAQSFLLDWPMRLTGITGIFDTPLEAELYAEIQPDANGVPAAGAALARSSLVLPAATPGSQKWTSIRLHPVVSLEAGQRYWMVLKGIRGEISVAIKTREEEPYGEILMNRGGQMWKRLGWAHSPPRLFQLDPGVQAWLVEGQVSKELLQVFKANQLKLSASAAVGQNRDGWQVTDSTAQRVYRIRPQQGSLEVCEPTLVGLLRLLYLPDVDNQTAAIEIRLEGLGNFQKVDPRLEAQSLSIPVSGWQGQTLILEVRSHARGTLSIANVVHEYKRQEADGRP